MYACRQSGHATCTLCSLTAVSLWCCRIEEAERLEAQLNASKGDADTATPPPLPDAPSPPDVALTPSAPILSTSQAVPASLPLPHVPPADFSSVSDTLPADLLPHAPFVGRSRHEQTVPVEAANSDAARHDDLVAPAPGSVPAEPKPLDKGSAGAATQASTASAGAMTDAMPAVPAAPAHGTGAAAHAGDKRKSLEAPEPEGKHEASWKPQPSRRTRNLVAERQATPLSMPLPAPGFANSQTGLLRQVAAAPAQPSAGTNAEQQWQASQGPAPHTFGHAVAPMTPAPAHCRQPPSEIGSMQPGPPTGRGQQAPPRDNMQPEPPAHGVRQPAGDSMQHPWPDSSVRPVVPELPACRQPWQQPTWPPECRAAAQPAPCSTAQQRPLPPPPPGWLQPSGYAGHAPPQGQTVQPAWNQQRMLSPGASGMAAPLQYYCSSNSIGSGMFRYGRHDRHFNGTQCPKCGSKKHCEDQCPNVSARKGLAARSQKRKHKSVAAQNGQLPSPDCSGPSSGLGMQSTGANTVDISCRPAWAGDENGAWSSPRGTAGHPQHRNSGGGFSGGSGSVKAPEDVQQGRASLAGAALLKQQVQQPKLHDRQQRKQRQPQQAKASDGCGSNRGRQGQPAMPDVPGVPTTSPLAP